MPPMKVTDGTPPTQKWVPQEEPLDLDEPLGHTGGCCNIHLEDLDSAVQHRIESWPGAVNLIKTLASGHISVALRKMVNDWLAANAPEESK